MSCVWVVIWFEALLSDIVKHFVLTFSRYGTICQYDRLKFHVKRVGAAFVLDKPMKLFTKFHHELCAGRDRIAIKQIWYLLALGLEFVFELLRVFS